MLIDPYADYINGAPSGVDNSTDVFETDNNKKDSKRISTDSKELLMKKRSIEST